MRPASVKNCSHSLQQPQAALVNMRPCSFVYPRINADPRYVSSCSAVQNEHRKPARVRPSE